MGEVGPSISWPGEEIGEAWRNARSSHPPGYLNAAARNVPDDRVLTAPRLDVAALKRVMPFARDSR